MADPRTIAEAIADERGMRFGYDQAEDDQDAILEFLEVAR